MVYTPVDKVTTQGYDLQFGTNVLGTKRGKFHKRPRPQTCSYRSLLFHQILPKGIILFLNELARRYGDELEAIVSISLHPGTDVSGQAGSLVQRVVRVFKYILVFVTSCGDMSFFRNECRAISNLTEHTHAGALANATGETETPSSPPIDSSTSRGAITLYAGTAPAQAAGELSGKVSYLPRTLP